MRIAARSSGRERRWKMRRYIDRDDTPSKLKKWLIASMYNQTVSRLPTGAEAGGGLRLWFPTTHAI